MREGVVVGVGRLFQRRKYLLQQNHIDFHKKWFIKNYQGLHGSSV